MKKFLKFVPCLLITASVLVSACACTDGINARRARKIPEPEIRQAEPLDPNFSVDPDQEPDEKPENPKCPECPEKDGKENRGPKHGWHHHGGHTKRKPMPIHRPPKKAD